MKGPVAETVQRAVSSSLRHYEAHTRASGPVLSDVTLCLQPSTQPTSDPEKPGCAVLHSGCVSVL